MTQRLVPFLGYEDAAAAIEWLERAFGFTEDREARYEESGVITHAELDVGGATIYLSTPAGYASRVSITLGAGREPSRRRTACARPTGAMIEPMAPT